MNKNIFHILVVDDDDRIRELVKQYLEENNFLVTTAIDAFDAKRKLNIIKFDILILDIMMPGKSGLSLTKEIKQNNPIPIMFPKKTAKGNNIEITIKTGRKVSRKAMPTKQKPAVAKANPNR